MTISGSVARKIIRKLLNGEDYRIEVVALINDEFLRFAVDFFKRVVNAKFSNEDITTDWYKKEFLEPCLPSKDIATNAGLNMKTIHNIFNSSKRDVVINASNMHYDQLRENIENLVDTEGDIDLSLTIKFKEVSVDLSVCESLIVINALAVKRSALRGGLWSTAGKRVEKPLMQALCGLHHVPSQYYAMEIKGSEGDVTDYEREVDFFLISKKGDQYKCEVKLMGKGNPESADAVIARGSRVFVADKLSDTNKKQLEDLKVEWVELRSGNGVEQFGEILKKLNVPHTRRVSPAHIPEIDDLLHSLL